MKTPKKIRHRHVRQGHTGTERIIAPKETVGKGLSEHVPDTDPKSTTFMLGLIFFLEPEKELEQEPFPGGEILVCD